MEETLPVSLLLLRPTCSISTHILSNVFSQLANYGEIASAITKIAQILGEKFYE
jgi:hypothetical protein